MEIQIAVGKHHLISFSSFQKLLHNWSHNIKDIQDSLQGRALQKSEYQFCKEIS